MAINSRDWQTLPWVHAVARAINSGCFSSTVLQTVLHLGVSEKQAWRRCSGLALQSDISPTGQEKPFGHHIWHPAST